MNIETLLNTYSLYLLIFGCILLAGLASISLKIKKPSADTKKLLFFSIVLVTLIPTLVLSGSTIYINTISESKGPVHWHADFEIWNCGQEVSLKDPVGLSNKLGTSTLHEHNDKRIHLEGVVLKNEDASLGNFFYVIGGDLRADSFSIPTNAGLFSTKNGNTCSKTGAGAVQVFVYQTDKDGYFSQKKIMDPASYVISPDSNVPPGDCIIVEFDTPKSRTDKLCRSYKVAEKVGKLKGERR